MTLWICYCWHVSNQSHSWQHQIQAEQTQTKPCSKQRAAAYNGSSSTSVSHSISPTLSHLWKLMRLAYWAQLLHKKTWTKIRGQKVLDWKRKDLHCPSRLQLSSLMDETMWRLQQHALKVRGNISIQQYQLYTVSSIRRQTNNLQTRHLINTTWQSLSKKWNLANLFTINWIQNE